MQRKRDGLVPIGDALSDLGGPRVASRRSAKPHHRRGGASVINQDRGRVAVLSSLARIRSPGGVTGRRGGGGRDSR